MMNSAATPFSATRGAHHGCRWARAPLLRIAHHSLPGDHDRGAGWCKMSMSPPPPPLSPSPPPLAHPPPPLTTPPSPVTSLADICATGSGFLLPSTNPPSCAVAPSPPGVGGNYQACNLACAEFNSGLVPLVLGTPPLDQCVVCTQGTAGPPCSDFSALTNADFTPADNQQQCPGSTTSVLVPTYCACVLK